MSERPALQDNRPFSEALTSLSPDFAEGFYDATPYSIVSNDRKLAESYNWGVWSRSYFERTSEKRQVIAIVGNGSFETAAQMFPDCPILFCDKNPVTLFAQRVILENLRNHTTPEDFLASMEDFTESLQPYVRTEMFDIRRSYEGQMVRWQKKSAEEPDHFLSSQEAYDAARDALMDREVGFWQLDLHDADEIRQLNQALDANNAEIVLANVTNLFRGMSGVMIRKHLQLAYRGVFMGARDSVNTSHSEIITSRSRAD